MQFPHPRDRQNGVSYAVWKQNEPMWSVRPSVCHGLDEDSSVRNGNSFSAGDIIDIDIYGTAVHNGGHCAFWWTTETSSYWYKIIDIKDCTLLNSVKVMLPYTMSTQCENKCTFAWSWVPFSSAACEVYMNCAEISVANVNGASSTDTPIKLKFDDFITQKTACQRVNEQTHWTNIFGSLKLDYTDDEKAGNRNTQSTGGNGDDDDDTNTGDDDDDTTTGGDDDDDNDGTWCPNPNAPNFNGDISNDGRCGDGNCVNCRCDDEQCCSASGYCGPDFAGYNSVTGEALYYYYGSDQTYYASKEEAYSDYCTNNLGDWRLVLCDSDDTTATETDGTGGAGVGDDDDNNSVDTDNIIIKNAGGIGEWWYAMYVEQVPSGYSISSVSVKSNDRNDYATGDLANWGPYVFTKGYKWQTPLSVKITSTSGETITGVNVVTDINAYSEFDFGTTFGSGGGSNNKGGSSRSSSSSDSNSSEMIALEWVIGVLASVVVIMCILGGFWYYRKQKMKKQVGYNDDINNGSYKAPSRV